jgi:hypothetical protein
MWIFTLDGFFSAVEYTSDPTFLLVRCRAADDAQRLADRLAEDGQPIEVQRTPTADYGWRLLVPRETFGRYLLAATNGVDYSNFKAAVADRIGHARADVYGDVWRDLLALQYPERHA